MKCVLICVLLLAPVHSSARAQHDAAPIHLPARYDPLPVFDALCSHVEAGFFDPEMNGADWHALVAQYRLQAAAAEDRRELSRIINALLAELKTSHTAHYTSDTVEYYHLRDIFESRGADASTRTALRRNRYEGIEAWLTRDGDSLFITGIWHGGNADQIGLLLGDEIVSIDGQRPEPIASFRGRGGQEVILDVRRHRGGEIVQVPLRVARIQPTEALLSATRNSIRIHQVNGVNVGCIHIPSYAGQHYQDVLLEAISRGMLARADALLLDIRGGWGGASPEYLSPFLAAPLLTMRSRDGETSMWPPRWRKPVALLVDEGSRSGKEVLAHGFRTYKLGPVIGERTAGAVVAGSMQTLPDGSILYLAVADVHCDGERLEGKGVEPDIHIPFDPRYAAGNDPQLDAGIETLARMVKAP